MLIIGIIMMLGGVGCLVYGFMQNNNIEAQFSSLLSSGSMNPGTIFIIIGAVVAVIGLILVIVGAAKKSKE